MQQKGWLHVLAAFQRPTNATLSQRETSGERRSRSYPKYLFLQIVEKFSRRPIFCSDNLKVRHEFMTICSFYHSRRCILHLRVILRSIFRQVDPGAWKVEGERGREMFVGSPGGSRPGPGLRIRRVDRYGTRPARWDSGLHTDTKIIF